jgi:hypothetical protein
MNTELKNKNVIALEDMSLKEKLDELKKMGCTELERIVPYWDSKKKLVSFAAKVENEL